MSQRSSTQSNLLTVTQVAAFLKLNKLTVYKYIREGKLAAIRLGRSFRVRREDVLTFFEAQKVAPARAAKAAPAPQADAGQPRAESNSTRAPAKHNEEIHVGPARQEPGRPRDTFVTGNPLDWAIRGLH